VNVRRLTTDAGDRARKRPTDAGRDDGVAERRVVFLLFPGCEVLDVAGPLQAFTEASSLGGGYSVVYRGATPSVRTAQGLEFGGLEPLGEPLQSDRVIVPGYPISTVRPPITILAWLRRARNVGAQICSVCTGAFALGEAGLLDGRRCTTHWKRVAELQQQFPRARVVGDRLFVEDGQIVSSAGIAAGIDMALALIDDDHGPVLASAVAREMVVYMRRNGAHRQESVYLDFQTHLNPGVHQLQQFLIAHPVGRETLGELSLVAGMSERNLTRVFKRATGISIQEYRERLRVERARSLLRDPTLTVDAVAAACGYTGARQLRRVWGQRFGGSPRRI
jgi:transcriptional regulator GlxA family with amidase domain